MENYVPHKEVGHTATRGTRQRNRQEVSTPHGPATERDVATMDATMKGGGEESKFELVQVILAA
jgi:hypothetical protein